MFRDKKKAAKKLQAFATTETSCWLSSIKDNNWHC